MIQMSRCFLMPVTLAFIASSAAIASPVVIDFEGLSDSTFVSTQYSNLDFSNAIIATAGISLNELEFPPNSGSNVVVDDAGPITISFTSPVSSFGAYFTYTVQVNLQGFGSSNNLLASSSSQYSNNLACLGGPPCQGDPGSSPNEFIQVTSVTGFSSVTITGDPAGFSFAMDDVTYSLGSTTVIPEPSSLVLLMGISLVIIIRRTNVAGIGRSVCRRRLSRE